MILRIEILFFDLVCFTFALCLQSPVPSASGEPEPRETTNPDPKSVTQESGSPKLRVCRSIMQEPMMGHLTLLGSPVPSASGSPERRGSTDPDPKSVIRKSGWLKLRVCRSIMQEPMAVSLLLVLQNPQAHNFLTLELGSSPPSKPPCNTVNAPPPNPLQ